MTAARTRLLVVVATGLLAALAVAASASAQSCADQIIDDWADNAKIDGTYEIECYRAAIAALPEDLRAYSSAADDIRLALQERLQADGGGDAGSGDGSSGDSSSGGGGQSDGGSGDGGNGQEDDSLAGEPAPGEEGGSDDVEPGGGETAAVEPSEPSAEAAGAEIGDGGASLPAPVIALLAAAGVVALGLAAWLVRRQLRGRGEA